MKKIIPPFEINLSEVFSFLNDLFKEAYVVDKHFQQNFLNYFNPADVYQAVIIYSLKSLLKEVPEEEGIDNKIRFLEGTGLPIEIIDDIAVSVYQYLKTLLLSNTFISIKSEELSLLKVDKLVNEVAFFKMKSEEELYRLTFID